MSALPGPAQAVHAFGRFVLDRDRRLLLRDGAVVAVTPKAFDLLVVLVERRGIVASKDELITLLWPDTVVEESNLAFQVSTLRKALGPDGASYIATIPGRGYQFVAPVETAEVPAAAFGPQREMLVEVEPRTASGPGAGRRWGSILLVTLALTLFGAAAAILLRKEAATPSVRSLAVLPFKPLASAERDEALELGMADTLITRLGSMPGVVVRPIGAVRNYTALDVDPSSAGKALEVAAVVDGSIQRRGSRVRVTVRLVRTSDGTSLWSAQFDDDARDLFAVQDRVAERVARAVVPALARQGAFVQSRRPTDDLEAYDLYLKGRYWAMSDPVRAEAFFQQAVARDPDFAAAWAAIADSWLFLTRYGNASPRENVEKARAAAIRAVTLDPQLADGHAALAQVYGDHDWDWRRAEQEYRRALELNPNSDVAHGHYAYLLLFRGEIEAALEHTRRATEINPLAPVWALEHGFALDVAGRHAEAIRHLEETVRVHPRMIPAYLHLGIASTNAGRPREGIAWLDKGLALAPDAVQLRALKAWAHARAGDRETALAIVREIESHTGQPPPAHNLALAWLALGDRDRAFAWLERAYDERAFLLRVITVQPGYAPLRDDPRYRSLVTRMGLPVR